MLQNVENDTTFFKDFEIYFDSSKLLELCDQVVPEERDLFAFDIRKVNLEERNRATAGAFFKFIQETSKWSMLSK